MLKKILLAILVLVLVVVAIEAGRFYHPNLPAPLPESYDYAKAIKLNPMPEEAWKYWGEGEKEDDKWSYDWWYHTSQGSLVLPESWFPALEQFSAFPLLPVNFQPFISRDNITRFRAIPDPKIKVGEGEDAKWVGSYWNPDGLPVGFVKTPRPNPTDGDIYVGVTCSACHTGQMTYDGKLYIIEGGAGQLDVIGTLQRLYFSLAVTISPLRPWKFRRFAAKVLEYEGKENNRANRKELKRKVVKFMEVQIKNQFLIPGDKALEATAGGFGRLDALNTGGNALYTQLDPSNYVPTNAPVTIPSLWESSSYDWVQLNGCIRQPLARNVIEALAVAAFVNVEADGYGKPQYYSTAAIPRMAELEEWHSALKAPEWPSVFGELDQAKVAKGRVVYKTAGCADCHARICSEWIGKEGAPPPLYPAPDPVSKKWYLGTYILRQFASDVLGTDPVDAAEFADRMVVGADKIGIGKPGEKVPGYAVIAPVISGIIAQRFKEEGITVEEQEIMGGYRAELWTAPKAYPARPMAGVWSSGSYLHNGSVPTLWDLLQKPDKRPKKFHTGSLEFNPKEVGYSTEKFQGSFELDTSKTGNSNSGHDYGTDLSDDDKWALIEYIKSVRSEDESWESYFPEGDTKHDWQEYFLSEGWLEKGYQGKEWVTYHKRSDNCKPIYSYQKYYDKKYPDGEYANGGGDTADAAPPAEAAPGGSTTGR